MNLKFSAFAPTKINLGLEILSKCEKGYHNVDMIMQAIDLFDEVSIEKTKDRKISVINEKNINCPQEKDIAYRCAELFFKESGIFNEGVLIKIIKNIPIGAGLAGGSSDGAAVLVLLNKMNSDFFPTEKLCGIGAKIGADIPFCILGGTARAFGTGTKLEKIFGLNNYHLVLVKPEFSISTKAAYELFDSTHEKNPRNFDSMQESLNNFDFKGFSQQLFNRFEQLINREIIYEIKRELCDFGAASSLMSGSGPSVYGIFENKESAQECFSKMKKSYPQVFLCKPIDYGIKII